MRKVKWLKEEFWELTPQQEEEVFCRADFVNAATTNYRKLVNSKPRKDEIGYIPKDGIKKRLVVRHPIKDIPTRRRRTAAIFEEQFDMFVPYWSYNSASTDEKEIGRMFGCKIML